MKVHHTSSIRNLIFLSRINPVVRLMIFSDIMVIMARLGLVAPLFAIYVTDTVVGGNLEAVGIATTIYMLTKSLFQLPASALIDKIKGERDDFWSLFLGTAFFAIVPLLYILVDTVLELYFIQFLFGLAASFLFPSWTAIFTRHIDREHEGVEWGVYFTLTDLSSAIAATLGGIIAYRFGFTPLFMLASLISVIGLFMLFGIRKDLRGNQNTIQNT